MMKMKKGWLALLIVTFFTVALYPDNEVENRVKTAFVEKFTLFVEWPDDDAAIKNAPSFVIGVLGQTPLLMLLQDMLVKRQIKNKPIEVKIMTRKDKLEACHLLFIAGSEKPHLDEILEQVASKPVLTIGDSDDFARRGVLINLIRLDDHVGFQINENAVLRSGLHFSAKLLKLAHMVDGK
jgi:hypothetical protein